MVFYVRAQDDEVILKNYAVLSKGGAEKMNKRS